MNALILIFGLCLFLAGVAASAVLVSACVVSGRISREEER